MDAAIRTLVEADALEEGGPRIADVEVSPAGRHRRCRLGGWMGSTPPECLGFHILHIWYLVPHAVLQDHTRTWRMTLPSA